MMHGWLKLRSAFPQSADEYTQPMEPTLQRRRAEMDEAWGKLEEGCAANNERMAEVGLRPRTNEEGVIKLNVGGSNVTVCWHLLAESEGFEDSVLGELLWGVWGKEQIPRDADGRIVLDESPMCIKHIFAQTTRRAINSGRPVRVEVGLPERSASSAMASDEVPCLMYTAHVMGLPESMPTYHPKYVNMSGSSTILETFEIAPFGAKIREWVGGSAAQMTLIYRATRDGFDAPLVNPKGREDRTHTVSLIRVKRGKGDNDDDDSIVGGYSVLPWADGVPGQTEQMVTAESFIFMLKDGSATGKDLNKPIKWDPNPLLVGDTYPMRQTSGLLTCFNGARKRCTLGNGQGFFSTNNDIPLSAFYKKEVVDIEVYRYSAPNPPTSTAPSITKPGGDVLTEAEAHEIDSFGRSIATSLMEERVVLDRAVKEMEAAGARVSAAIGALQTLYGPSVAAEEQDAVVELNVRGMRMTTLRSTLQACPRSALSTMFEDRWPATDKDKDDHGRRLIDCSPICFSKILDVLRMRKRDSWSRGWTPEKQDGISGKCPGAVLVKQSDMKAFRTAVEMYFPGCESFILGLCSVYSIPPA
ncbi:unnamed protein product [Laminaria digitata]